MSKGFIYVMSNEIFRDGRLKIGMTKSDPNDRRKELYTTGVPEPYKLEYYAFVPNYEIIEKKVHRALVKFRPRKDREHFLCSVPEAILAIRDIADVKYEEIFYKSPEEIKQEEQERIRRQKEIEEQKAERLRQEKQERIRRQKEIEEKKVFEDQARKKNELEEKNRLRKKQEGEVLLKKINLKEREIKTTRIAYRVVACGLFFVLLSFAFDNTLLLDLGIFMSIGILAVVIDLLFGKKYMFVSKLEEELNNLRKQLEILNKTD